jgi:glycosyltransferase involved in cell wall biosynthesis
MGGAETWLVELLRLWSATRSVKMDFLLTSGSRGVFDDEVLALGARVFYVPYRRATRVQFVRTYRQILKRGQYDAIHHHADYASGWHFLAGVGRLPRVRVTHLHNTRQQHETNYASSRWRKLKMRFGRFLVRCFATHICGTSSDVLRGYGSGRRSNGPALRVIHCGIDLSPFRESLICSRPSVLEEFEWPSDAQVVLFVGRLDVALEYDNPTNHKNSWLAVNVAYAAAKANPRVRLLMVGAGESREYQRHIDDWQMTARLRLTGIRRDVPRLMQASSVLLFPSRAEGLGMVAIEAQAARLPVLMSDGVPAECTVIPELVHRRSLQSSVDEWARHVLDILACPGDVMNTEARLSATQFAIANSAAALEAVLAAGASD